MAVPATRSTFGRVSKTKMMDVPASSASPAEIDTTDALTTQITIITETEINLCYAADAAAAATAIGAYDCIKIAANSGLSLGVAKNGTDKLYIRSTGSAGTKTLSYALTEED